MASDPLPSVPASDRDVWRRSHVFVHLAASVAGGDNAWRLEALAKYNGHERRHRDFGRWDDSPDRPWAIPAGAPTNHDSGGVDRRLAVLCPTPVRAHLLVPRRGLEFSRSCAARKFLLSPAERLALV